MIGKTKPSLAASAAQIAGPKAWPSANAAVRLAKCSVRSNGVV
jgi:hypothetical protein